VSPTHGGCPRCARPIGAGTWVTGHLLADAARFRVVVKGINMSAGVDLSQFYETFFDEADELLSDMEQTLLSVDVEQPDIDQLNAIFRAAHSIKGGAGTFGCFGHLAETTHLLENLLDSLRQ